MLYRKIEKNKKTELIFHPYCGLSNKYISDVNLNMHNMRLCTLCTEGKTLHNNF